MFFRLLDSNGPVAGFQESPKFTGQSIANGRAESLDDGIFCRSMVTDKLMCGGVSVDFTSSETYAPWVEVIFVEVRTIAVGTPIIFETKTDIAHFRQGRRRGPIFQCVQKKVEPRIVVFESDGCAHGAHRRCGTAISALKGESSFRSIYPFILVNLYCCTVQCDTLGEYWNLFQIRYDRSNKGLSRCTGFCKGDDGGKREYY